MKRLNALRMVAALLAALAALPASGQTYPGLPVKIVLPFGAGGVADVSSRIIADKLGERLGQMALFKTDVRKWADVIVTAGIEKK